MGGGRGVGQVGQRRAVLQAAGLADGLDAFDPAAALLALGAALKAAHQDGVSERALRPIVGVIPSLG